MTLPRTRVQRHPVHGVLLLDKPKGYSSNQALQKAKWLLRAEKAGHTGTLDPFATGVLPLCFGAATKFSQLQLDANKSYEAIAQLGVTTSTGDPEGEVLQTQPVTADMLTAEKLEAVRQQFTGKISQIPPMYSALKKDGKALYEYARAGVEVERQARQIEIYGLALELRTANTLLIKVQCSKGTYIRTLAEDIGTALGCGAHLLELRRVQTGGFDALQCITIEALEATAEPERKKHLLPVDSLLTGLPRVKLNAEDAGRFLSGLRRRGTWQNSENVAVYGRAPHTLLGTAHTKADELIPNRLLNPLEIQQMVVNK